MAEYRGRALSVAPEGDAGGEPVDPEKAAEDDGDDEEDDVSNENSDDSQDSDAFVKPTSKAKAAPKRRYTELQQTDQGDSGAVLEAKIPEKERKKLAKIERWVADNEERLSKEDADTEATLKALLDSAIDGGEAAKATEDKEAADFWSALTADTPGDGGVSSSSAAVVGDAGAVAEQALEATVAEHAQGDVGGASGDAEELAEKTGAEHVSGDVGGASSAAEPPSETGEPKPKRKRRSRHEPSPLDGYKIVSAGRVILTDGQCRFADDWLLREGFSLSNLPDVEQCEKCVKAGLDEKIWTPTACPTPKGIRSRALRLTAPADVGRPSSLEP